jgi:DNA-binding beta-propeller fold protein YncE
MRTQTATRFASCLRCRAGVEETSNDPYLYGSRGSETDARPLARVRGRGIRPDAVAPLAARSLGARRSGAWLLRFALAWMVGIALVGGALPLLAQTAQSGATITVLNDATAPNGVAVDGSGDVFLVDTNDNAIREIAAVNGIVSSSSTQSNVGSGFNVPVGVAVDGRGDVFVADDGSGSVKEIVAVNGVVTANSTVNLVANFYSPTGVAVDSSGDVFVAAFGQNSVNEIVAVNGVVSSSSAVITLGSGFNSPMSVAVDGRGDVFVADDGDSAVKEIVAVNGVVSSSSVVNRVGSGFSFPVGVAVDGSGNVYVTENGANAVKEIVAVNGVVSSSSAVNTVTPPGDHSFQGLAVDGRGNVFFTYEPDQSYGEVFDNGALYEIVAGAQKFPSTAVGSASAPLTTYFTFTSSGTLASTPYVVLTQGAQGKDFQASASQLSNACVTGHTYNVGDVCTVNVTFTPARPFQRLGAVQLMGSAGAPIATFDLSGTGTGPMVTFPSNSAVTALGGGFLAPVGVAVDGSGNIFVADDASGLVEEIAAATGNVTPVGSGFNFPSGVAVDGSGNVFVADAEGNSVFEIVAVNGAVSAGSTVNPVGSGFSSPQGVAVDGSGNVFVSDYSNAVYEIVAVNGVVSANSIVNRVGSGFNYPQGVAVDASGDVFVADSGNSAVKEIAAVDGVVSSGSAVTTVGSGFNGPRGVALDGLGNVFVADFGNGEVKEIAAVNGAVSSGSPVTTLGSGFAGPFGVAVDGSGNIFVVDRENSVVKEIDRSDPPTLTFAATTLGQTSTDSPMSIQVENSGNQPLSAMPPGIAVGANFAQVSGNGTYPDCTAGSPFYSPVTPYTPGFNLTPGAECNLSISFTPQSIGQIQSAAVLFDNALNASSSQAIPLVGTGTAIAPTINFMVPNQTYGVAPFQVNATSNSSGAFTYSVVSGTAKLAGNTVTIYSAAGPVTLRVSQAASGNYTAGSTTTTFTVFPDRSTISLAGMLNSSSNTATLTATVGVASSVATGDGGPTGTVTFSNANGPIGTATVGLNGVANFSTTTYTGSQSFTATYNGDVNFTPTTPSDAVTLNFPVNPTTTYNLASTYVYGQSFSITDQSNSTGAITYTLKSGPASISGSTVTVTGEGAVQIQASQAAAPGYNASTQTLTFTAIAASTSTSLTGSVNPGNTATLSATVSATAPGSGIPTGTVTFSNASGQIGTTPLTNGVATLTTPTYSGSQSFTATYNSDHNFNGSPSNAVTLSFTVNPTTTFSYNAAPPYAYGESFTIAAKSNSTGTITYKVQSGPATVSGSTVTVTGEGAISILASQAAAPGYNASTQTLPSMIATQASSTTRLTATGVKSGTGTAATLTATVSPQYTGIPTGSVTFYDGQTKLATVALSGGTATYTTPQLVGGSHSYTATYTGDTNFTGSTSNTATLSVPVTTVSLQLLSTKLVYPEPPAFAIKVGTGASPAPTGTVTIYDGTTVVGTYTLYAQFKGNLLGLVLPPLNVGTHMLQAVYSGDANYAPGQSSIVTVTVTPGPVKLSLSCANTKLTLGQTLTCTVNADEGPLPVTGSVNYTVTNWGSGSVTLNKAGQATITYLETSRGTFTLTATYAAQGNYQAAPSASVTFTVN